MTRHPKDGKRPQGRPPKHHARWLARRLKENGLDGRTGPAKLLKLRADELADDAGGWSYLTNRESVLVRRTAALLLLCETIEHHVFRQPSPFTDTGELLAVLAKSYIAYSNTARLNLVALGLRPERADRVPSLQEYLQSRRDSGAETRAEKQPQA
jgi:hypothetical protein